MEPWVAGDWELVPGGLSVLGNGLCTTPLPSDAESEDATDTSVPFVEKLCTSFGRRNIITQSEAEELLALVDGDDWDHFLRDNLIHVQRHKDRQLFDGCIFVKISGCFPGTTVDHVAHCHMNFLDRAQWDKQMDGFKVLNHSKGNDILHCVLHSAPLSDRDFLLFHTVLRHQKRSGLMFYSRSADDMFYPRTSAVRATQYMAAHQFIQDGNDVFFTTTTAVEPHIAFLPRWVMTWLLPSEFKRWRLSVLRRCKELLGQKVPCSTLFEALPEVPLSPTKATVETDTTGEPSTRYILNDIVIEDVEDSKTCCCTG